MLKLIVKCRKANVTHMLLPSVFVAVHEEKRKEAAQHKHKEREGLEYNRRAVFENRRESLHICLLPGFFQSSDSNGFFAPKLLDSASKIKQILSNSVQF